MPAISYTYVWLNGTVEAFTGVDSRTYGPFKEGDFANMPTDDADRLVSQGVASFEAPIPGLSKLLTAIAKVTDDVETNAEKTDTLMTQITSLVNTVSAQNSQITMLLICVAANIIVTLVLFVYILIRKK
jgi:hypothetical protein